jgi:phosphoribosylformimino-5-aminoimidazole carboxamide ribotide isomerase
MIIIPAVDIKNGKCVRLLQGRMDRETVFSHDPAAMARKWARAGAELIHVIDLDGAFAKQPQNMDAISRLVKSIDVPVQLGGGIRDIETIRMLIEMGVERTIIGTQAVQNPEFVNKACEEFPGQIVLGIDARKGRVAVEGWSQTTSIKAIDLARQFETSGLAAINFTDIHRDGMLTGPNIEEIRIFAEKTPIPVVASGGVSNMVDIQRLLELESLGVIGAIVGKALYSGTLNLKDAIAVALDSPSSSRHGRILSSDEK